MLSARRAPYLPDPIVDFQIALPPSLAEGHCRALPAEQPDRAILYRPAETLHSVWIVDQGYLKLHRVSPSGRPVTIALLGRGAVLGAVGGPVTAEETATAQGPVRLWRLDHARCEALLASDPAFARFMALSLGQRRDALQRRLYHVMHRKVEQRLAAVLHDLVRQEGAACVHGGELDVRLTQQDLADLVGAARQVVSTILNRLRESGVVDYSRDFLCVEDMDALAQLAED